jgi:hypothetical protein
MKKSLVASLLGLAAATSAFGQESIQFNNYQSTTFQQVTWGGVPVPALGITPGAPVNDPNVELQLFWALGTFSSQAAFQAAANAGVTTFINPLFTYNGGGYYAGPIQILTAGSPSQTVTFEVEGWETAGPFGGPTFATSSATGVSALWTETAAPNSSANGLQPSSNPATFFNNGPPAMSIVIMPEPSMFALSGIGVVSFMLKRRKKTLNQ